MTVSNKYESLILFLGDLFFFVSALFLTLLVRYAEFPSDDLFYNHIVPFSLLFIVWVVVFFIAGLYDRHTTFFKSKLPDTILQTQLLNILIAAVFFFMVPYFGIAPKTNLLIYLIISSIFIILWRLYIFPFLRIGRKTKAILIGSGKETKELYEEVQGDGYNLSFEVFIDLDKVSNPNDIQSEVLEKIVQEDISVIVTHTKDKQADLLMPFFYNLTFMKTSMTILDVVQVYEEVFRRIPLSMINHDWIIEHIRPNEHVGYRTVKRAMDLTLAGVLYLCALLVYPFVMIAIKLEDSGPLFITQERIGKNNHKILIRKFRSMSGNDNGKYGDTGKTTLVVTRIGSFLRKTRIDELPQLVSVLRGDQSLVGPRPELPHLVTEYTSKIPHYPVRHLVQPGLSGWAQINHQAHPHHGADIVETKVKLSYDLYYVKNRSIILDMVIALKTAKILLQRVGS